MRVSPETGKVAVTGLVQEVTDHPTDLDTELQPLAEGDEVEEECLGERAPIKARSKPIQPSVREIEEHEVTHYPYRSWCRYCVAASGRRDKHASVSQNIESEIACIACDYGFFTSKEDEDKPEEELEKKYTPFLATVDDQTKCTFGDVVHRKGVEDWSVKVLVEPIVDLGHPKVKLFLMARSPSKLCWRRFQRNSKEKA